MQCQAETGRGRCTSTAAFKLKGGKVHYCALHTTKAEKNDWGPWVPIGAVKKATKRKTRRPRLTR